MGRFVEVISDTTGGAERRVKMPLDTFANELTEQGLPSSTDLDAKLDIDFAEQLTPATDDRVNANTMLAGVVDAVARVVEGTCTGAGTADSTITLGGATLTVDSEPALGDSAATFISNIVDAVNAHGGTALAAIPAESIGIDPDDDTKLRITLAAGAAANALVFSTDDPALSFSDVTNGADAATKSITAGQVNGCLRYVALLTQASNNPPTAEVLVNELGEVPTFTYENSGFYTLVTVGNVFTANKTFVLCRASRADAVGGDVYTFAAYRSASSIIAMETCHLQPNGGGNLGIAAGSDGILAGWELRIEVYP